MFLIQKFDQRIEPGIAGNDVKRIAEVEDENEISGLLEDVIAALVTLARQDVPGPECSTRAPRTCRMAPSNPLARTLGCLLSDPP